MKKTIAICSNIPIFWNNKILDHEFCAQYFGASWMPIFSEIAMNNGYKVVSGDIALYLLKRENLLAHNVLVIQELNAKHGKALLKMGARGAILTGAESPLFSYFFYDHLKKIASHFAYKKLFDGSFALINEKKDDGSNFQFFFPSYSIHDDSKNEDLQKRNFMVMIAANKNGYSPIPKGLKNKITWLIHFTYKLFSSSFKKAQSHELHTKRLEMIKYFGVKNMLHLFGSNWQDYFRFETTNREELKTIIEKLNPNFVQDKIETLSQYKFAICFENISFDGYITEKIIHCFLAGTIPIYLGADNITDYIPSNCFIDFRNYKSLEDLETFLLNLKNEDIEKIIDNGKKFLGNKAGQKFSYEYFAQDILEKIKSLNHDNNQ